MHNAGRTVSFLFTGDVYLGARDSVSLSDECRALFEQCDIVVINQEGPITQRESCLQDKICLRNDPSVINDLIAWRVGVASLANNHMFDSGWEGFEDTRRSLREAGIKVLGAGSNLEEALAPVRLTLNGVSIGLLACAWEVTQATCATQDGFGCAPVDHDALFAAIRELRETCDLVVVMPHWGYCDYVIPPPEMVSLGPRMLDAGANLVVGHHPHVVQGLREYANGLIVYSLGNFCFTPYSFEGRSVALSRDNMEGAALRIKVKPGGSIEHEVLFTRQEDNIIELDTRSKRYRTLARRSSPLQSNSYHKTWRWYVRKRFLRRLAYWADIRNWQRINRLTIRSGMVMLKQIVGIGRRR